MFIITPSRLKPPTSSTTPPEVQVPRGRRQDDGTRQGRRGRRHGGIHVHAGGREGQRPGPAGHVARLHARGLIQQGPSAERRCHCTLKAGI